jgi:hypothetical protein
VREVWIARARYGPVVRRLEVDEAVKVLEHYERRSGLPRSLVWSVLGRLITVVAHRVRSGAMGHETRWIVRVGQS